MSDSPGEDNDSIHSDESNISTSHHKEKLEYLVNMEQKHSGVYCDLNSKNNLLKVDLENMYNSCQRFENLKKKKSEFLEELYEKAIQYQKNNTNKCDEHMQSVIRECDQVDHMFHTEFNNFKADNLRKMINKFNVETKLQEQNLSKILEEFDTIKKKGNFNDQLIKRKCNQMSNIDIINKTLSDSLTRHVDTKLKETESNLENNVEKLEQRRKELYYIEGRKPFK